MSSREISRRSLLGLDRSTPASPLDRFYEDRDAEAQRAPRPKVPEELRGSVEATRVGAGESAPQSPEEIPLPDLQDQEIDEGTLRQLVFDIDKAAELIDVRFKGGAQAHAVRVTPSLSEAVEALLERRVTGVQLRYRYRGRQWWDTLLRTEGGVRIVRIEQPFT